MQIEHIREFQFLAECLSFSTTAKRLFITQSALSRHISGIEEELGAKLLTRGIHGTETKLTPIGETFYRDSRRLLQTYDNTVAEIEQLKQGTDRILRIGYINHAGFPYLPRVAKLLEKATPKIMPRYQAFEYGKVMKALSSFKIDAAITIDTGLNPQYPAKKVKLGTDRHFAAVPKDHPLASRKTVTLRDIAQEPIIFPNEKAMGSRCALFCETIKANELGITPAAYYEDIPSLVYQVQYGEGVTLMLGHHAKRYENELAFIPIVDCDTTCDIILMWHEITEEHIPGTWSDELMKLGK